MVIWSSSHMNSCLYTWMKFILKKFHWKSWGKIAVVAQRLWQQHQKYHNTLNLFSLNNTQRKKKNRAAPVSCVKQPASRAVYRDVFSSRYIITESPTLKKQNSAIDFYSIFLSVPDKINYTLLGSTILLCNKVYNSCSSCLSYNVLRILAAKVMW